MNTEVNKTSRSTRQPLSPLARTAVRTLVGMVIVSGITSLFSSTLVVFTLIALISLVLVARRIRWALLPAALASGAIVVYLIQNAAGAYLLLHPKDALSCHLSFKKDHFPDNLPRCQGLSAHWFSHIIWRDIGRTPFSIFCLPPPSDLATHSPR